jgi:hypothetical protein
MLTASTPDVGSFQLELAQTAIESPGGTTLMIEAFEKFAPPFGPPYWFATVTARQRLRLDERRRCVRRPDRAGIRFLCVGTQIRRDVVDDRLRRVVRGKPRIHDVIAHIDSKYGI